MRHVKFCAFVLVLLISGNGYSFIHVCGNHTGTDGVTSVQCFNFSGKCDDEKNLAGLGELFPGGWTCAMSGIAVQETGSVHLIAAKDGSASVVVGGVRTPVGSDDFLEFVNRLQRENQGLRVNTQVLQGQLDAFLDTDSGVVSNVRLQELSRELGVPIEYEGSSRPGVQPGMGRGTAAPGPASPSVQPKTSQAARTGPENPGARRPDQCSLPDCSCRVVSESRELLCDGGTEEETSAGVHYCKCGKFGAPSAQSVGAGGDFTVSDTGATGRSEPAEGMKDSVAKPRTPTPRPTSDIREGNLQAQRHSMATAVPPAQSRPDAPDRSDAASRTTTNPETCVAEYQIADSVEVFFREDRQITGVWTVKPGERTSFQKPGVIVADANGCLYGCTGNVWEPLDCPGRDFSSPETYPGEFTMGASCSSTKLSGLDWRRQNEGRGGAMDVSPPALPVSRFVLADQESRPPQTDVPSDGSRRPVLHCWFYTRPGGWLPRLRCCIFRFETLPNDTNTFGTMEVEDCDINVRTQAAPDVQDGTIVLRSADGRDSCLNPNGSFGACASGFGIKEQGIK